MGMGNYACHADTVTDEFVREICPTEIEELEFVLDSNDYSMGQLGYCADTGDIQGELELELDEDVALLVLNAYEKVCAVFEDKTGLELDLKYHNNEDRGDEVDEEFWTVEGVYIFSPAGEKYKDKIERKFWTNFG